MSLPVLRITPSAGRPLATACPCAEDGPYDARTLMSDPAGVLRNSSISLVSTGRGVEYATRLSVTAFVLFSAAVAAPATAVAITTSRIAAQANVLRSMKPPRSSVLMFTGACPPQPKTTFSVEKVVS